MTSRAAPWLFYGGLSALLALILTTLLPEVLPQPWVSRISYNSEAYLFAVVLGSWLQFGLPRLPEEQRMYWAMALGATLFLVGIGLLMSDLPSRFRTLNETALALAVLLPYVTLRRPLPRRVVVLVAVVIAVLVIWAVVRAPESWVIDQAESLGLIFLAVLTFDLMDPELLQPERRTPVVTRVLWYGLIIAEPVIVSGLGTAIRSQGDGLSLALNFLGRIHESFFGMLLVALVLIVAPRGAPRDAPQAIPGQSYRSTMT